MGESSDLAIVGAMLRWDPPSPIGRPRRASNLDSWELPREAGDLVLRDPNACLIGGVFDYGIKANKAWVAPLELSKRLGHLNVRKIAEMGPGELAKFIRRGAQGPALHRFVAIVSQRVVSACRKLVKEYGGLASNIWPDGMPAKDVISRLDGFDGIGQKISRMMARLLVTYIGVRLTRWGDIDVAVDRHVARVFLRSGLVGRPLGSYCVSEVKDDVIRRARELHGAFPAALDEPAFSIGKDWCAAGKPDCDWEEEPCPLAGCCRRLTRMRILEAGSSGKAACRFGRAARPKSATNA